MKNKILAILMLHILVFASLNVLATDENGNGTLSTCTKSDLVSFSDLNIETKGEYIILSFEQANTYLDAPGKPSLPVCVKTYKFPIGYKIYNVDFTYFDVEEKALTGKIKPAPQPVPLISLETQTKAVDSEEPVEDASVYKSSEIYPDKWYEYSIGVGLDGTQRVLILTVRIYPVRYEPEKNTIYYISDAEVKITYEQNASPVTSGPTYDLIIITPRKYRVGLLSLMNHKNKVGVSTKIVTTESIYLRYKGRDRQEKIKLFIKDAIENYNTTYVLLVGGRQGFGKWILPARYSNLEDRGGWNETYVTDLYYADIYKWNATSQEVEFDDWDSNGNGIFAEWKWTWNGFYWTWPITSMDVLDLYPDVYVGRLACRNLVEVLTVARKIIKYENNAYNQSWFKDMIVAGGDTVPYGDGVAEGEYENNYSAVIMESIGFNVTRLWTSTGTLNSSKDVINAVAKGAGFLYFSGHGSPIVWSTHPFENTSWIDALWVDEMNDLKNKAKLPICVVGGCHNSQFDVALVNLFKGLLKLRLQFFSWIDDEDCFGKLAFLRRCWSWNLVRQKNGGSIATIGNTGLGWGVGGEGSIEGQDGFITSHFFEVYNTSALTDPVNCTLGLVHSQTISLYVQTFEPNNDELDRKTVEQWVLLGDPSLKIGGYPS
jgi:hypothetical protein